VSELFGQANVGGSREPVDHVLLLQRRGVITLVIAPGDSEVTVATGLQPAGPASKRQPIRTMLAPDERPVSKGALCGQRNGRTGDRAWPRTPRPSRPPRSSGRRDRCPPASSPDDGWDMYGAPNAVRLENCWAYKNGKNFTNASNFNGDGNGFKLDHSAGDLAHHVAVNCLSWGNLGANGFEDNNNTGGLTLFNNVAYKNKGAGFEAINVTKHIVKNNISLLNGRADDVLVGSDELSQP
jgi:hypothetical protein